MLAPKLEQSLLRAYLVGEKSRFGMEAGICLLLVYMAEFPLVTSAAKVIVIPKTSCTS